MNFQDFADIALKGDVLSREQCHAVLNCPDQDLLALIDAAYRVRREYFGNRVHVQLLTNAKSGICPEDCHYCSQSKISKAEVETYPLIPKEKLLGEARQAKEINAKRFCMALSGHAPNEQELDQLCEAVREIKAETNLELCGSLGFVDAEQAKKLKAAGLNRVNHNLNTSERYHPEICTTHTYAERMETIKTCQEAGLEICSGGIVGQGETDDDVIDLFLALREIRPHSIPVNFLIPVEGTPFAQEAKDMTPQRALKVLSLARFLCPDREVRASGGREHHLRTLQPLALYVADSIFVSGYLTTGGQPVEEALAMIEDLGFELVVEDNTGEDAKAILAELAKG